MQDVTWSLTVDNIASMAIGGAVVGDMDDTVESFRFACLACHGDVALTDMEVASLALDIYNRIRE
jgi:hypothetical protein